MIVTILTSAAAMYATAYLVQKGVISTECVLDFPKKIKNSINEKLEKYNKQEEKKENK